MEQLLEGVWIVLQPMNVLMMLIGLGFGVIVGILPGIGSPMGCALLIPFTFSMRPIEGILIMVAMYATSTYAGSITSILFKIPGEAPSIPTTFDGYELTRKGRAGEALGVAIFSSCLGGIFGVIVLILIAPRLSAVALRLGEAEYFAMAVLGLSVCAGIGGGSAVKNLLSAFAGLFLATWGLDEVTGIPRFTFGTDALILGISFVPAIIGLFAIGEVFEFVETSLKDKAKQKLRVQEKVKIGLPPLSELWRMKWLYLRSAVLGNFLGILPGIGALAAAFFGYSEAVRWSKHPEKFGTGIIDGVAAPETANNAAAAGTMVPLLTLGIPGSGFTAVMVGAFIIHGIRPGPMMMIQNPKLVNSIFAGMLFSNLLIVLSGIIGIKFLVKILNISYAKVGAAILLFCVIGSYSIRNAMTDVFITFCFGVLGYFMKKYGYGLAPMVLGMILGPLCEASFQRAMIIADKNFFIVATRPLAGSMLAFAVLSLCYPWVRDFFKGLGKGEKRAIG